MVLTQNRYVDQWIRVENPEINPPIHHKSIYNKGGKNIQRIKDNLFNKWFWENRSTTCKRMKLEQSLTLDTKINSKWLKDLNTRCDTVKLLGENTDKTLSDINHSNVLIAQSPKAIEIKAKINK